MKKFSKHILSLSLTLLLTAGMLFTGAQATETTPAVSDNSDNRYTATNFATPDKSALYRDGDYLTRVENIGSEVVIERYDDEFEIVTQRYIAMELPLWGGFFNGEQYNFLIFGQENPEESDSVEVVRVVKYDKSWNRLGAASLYGENTTIPFDAGGLDCAEKDGELYVHTAHEMYASSDGLNHQANLTFSVRVSDMSVSYCSSGISNLNTGYVSHSFQQRIMVDSEGRIVTVDHGDAYPRSIGLCRFTGGLKGSLEYTEIQGFPGEIGDNTTGASLGDIAETKDYYIVSYNYDGKGDNSVGRGVYMAMVHKTDFSVTIKELSRPGGAVTLSNTVPYLVPTENGGYILWNDCENSRNSGDLFYVTYDADGNTSQVKNSFIDKPMLSDCRPIYDNGKVVWYTTKNSEPKFFLVDESGIFEEPFDEEAHTIRDVTIDNLTEPIAGQVTRDNTVSYSPNIHYKVEWSDAEGKVLSDSDKFEVGGVYTTTITLTPYHKYFFAEDVTFTVNGEEWTATAQGDSYVLTKTYPAVEPIRLVRLSFFGNGTIDVPKAAPNEIATASITMKVIGYYSDNTSSELSPGEEVLLDGVVLTPEWFFVNEQPEGVSLDKNVLTVTNHAQDCEVLIGARVGDINAQRLITINRNSSYLATAWITEDGEDLSSATINIPKSSTASYRFSGSFYDQYGMPINYPFRWSINGDIPNGVEFISDGTVTVSADAQECEFEMIFYSPYSSSGRDYLTVTLVKGAEEEPDTGDNGGDGETSGGTTPSEPDEGGSTGGTTTPSEPDEGGSTGGTTPSEPDEGGSTGGTTTPSEPDEGGSTGGTTPSQPDEGGNETPDTGDGEIPPVEETPEEENPEDGDDAATEENTVFSDVPENSYYYDAVSWAVENGITSGTGGGKFSPGSICTRAQAVTFLWRAAGSPEVEGDMEFSDIPADAYYAKAVKWAVQNGITSGTGEGKFSPNAVCSRAQIVTFLHRTAGSPKAVDGMTFNDVSPDSYYADAVQWAVDNVITAGTGSGKFSPANDCTRAQIVTFLYRAYA